MNLNKADMFRIGVSALTGVCIASGYTMFNIYTSKHIPKLYFDTDAIHLDTLLFNEIRMIEKDSEKHDSIAFIRMVDMIDRILYLRQGLQNGTIIPTPSDQVYTIDLWSIMYQNMIRLLNQIEKKMDAQKAVLFQKHVVKISTYVEKHLSVIMRVCTNP